MFNFLKKQKEFTSVVCADNEIVAPADGTLIDITTVSDPIFAEKMMGESVAFRFYADSVSICAPANGKLTMLFSTGHAFGITMNNGAEILVHIGVDTVSAKGDGFALSGKKQGDYVQAGEPIVTMNQRKLKDKYDLSTMVIVTNSNDLPVTFEAPQQVMRGKIIGRIG